MNPQQLHDAALAELQRQLGPRAPHRLTPVGIFDEAPLEGEGRTALFSFELPPANDPCSGDGRHYVAVGLTTPTYFPSYDFDADDAYSFHIGTRFMVEMRIARIDADQEPPAARDEMRKFVIGCNPAARIERDELAALFTCDGQKLAVYRVVISGRPLYVLGGDCPPGFYELVQHPPQVALRLHLGKLIRAEAESERRRPQRHRL
ncbi:hypothetical protein RAS1_40460 [Phycisphaerae bacterium RAS1]|nr:hypothetical protein RAS1_40460 [Phycisphaerae bacterium RAS1]